MSSEDKSGTYDVGYDDGYKKGYETSEENTNFTKSQIHEAVSEELEKAFDLHPGHVTASGFIKALNEKGIHLVPGTFNAVYPSGKVVKY